MAPQDTDEASAIEVSQVLSEAVVPYFMDPLQDEGQQVITTGDDITPTPTYSARHHLLGTPLESVQHGIDL